MKTFSDGMKEVAASLNRDVGAAATLALTLAEPHAPRPYSFTIGAPEVTKVGKGYIISLGLTRDQLIEVREQCNDLLGIS